jgi:arylformamidase
MIAEIQHHSGTLKVDFDKPIDISLPLEAGEGKASAWYVPPVRMEPVRNGDWTGSVKEGGSVNFRDIYFNPHGHGTHTECVGHITAEWYSVFDSLKTFFFLAKLVTITPEIINGDKIITAHQLQNVFNDGPYEALILRTLPNDASKKTRAYSNTNPPYIHVDAMQLIRRNNIMHLLTDLPSVDREVDEGKLLAHHAFWNYPEKPLTQATITEFIYAPDEAADGRYLLNLQTASFVNDAAPSRPVLYKIF